MTQQTGDKLSNVLAMVGHICSDLNQGALSACLPFLMMYNGYSYTSVTFLVFIANICSAVIQPLFGAIGDKKPCPWFMALGVFCAGLGMCLIGFAPNYFLVCASAMLAGAGNSMFHPEGGRISNLAAGTRKSNGMSIFAVGGNIGFFIGPFLAAIFLTNFGMHGTLIFLVPAVLCSATLLAFNNRFKALGKAADAVSDIKRNEPEHWKNFWVCMLSLACRGILQYGLLAFIPLFFVGVLGQTEATGSIVLCLYSVAGAVATFLSGKTTEKYGVHKVAFICYALTLVSLIIFAFTTSVSIACVLVILLSIATDLFYPSQVALGMSYVPKHLGTASGISYGLVLCVGGMCEPLLGMVGDNVGLPQVMLTMAGIAFLGTIATFIVRQCDKKLKNNQN